MWRTAITRHTWETRADPVELCIPNAASSISQVNAITADPADRDIEATFGDFGPQEGGAPNFARTISSP
jgi:hypothetical protein